MSEARFLLVDEEVPPVTSVKTVSSGTLISLTGVKSEAVDTVETLESDVSAAEASTAVKSAVPVMPVNVKAAASISVRIRFPVFFVCMALITPSANIFSKILIRIK